jgi:hypothetical protein
MASAKRNFFYIKVRMMDNVQNYDSYILIYHPQKPIDSINLLDS